MTESIPGSLGSAPISTGGGPAGGSKGKSMLVLVSVVIVVLMVVLGALLIFGSREQGSGPSVVERVLLKTEPSAVALETTYENPFDPNSQYVNPFQEYKSPFQSLQQ